MIGIAIAPGLVAGTASVLVATTFTNTVSAGVIALSALAALATIVGIVYGVRWKTAYAVEVKAREGEAALNQSLEDRVRAIAHDREDLKLAMEELKTKLAESTTALLNAQAMVARLEPLKDMGAVLEMVTRTFERLRDRQESMHVESKRDGDRRLQIVIEEFRADRVAMLAEIQADRAALLDRLGDRAG